MSAKHVLSQAASLVGGDRNNQHGDIETSFRNIAVMWNAWMVIRKNPNSPLDEHDVAQMMSLLKKARTQLGEYNKDDYIDDAGYSAIASEVADPAGEAKRQGVPFKH